MADIFRFARRGAVVVKSTAGCDAAVTKQSYALGESNKTYDSQMYIAPQTLSALRSVAETGSYAAAARSMGVTQPAVAQKLKKLESDHGLVLFHRESGRLIATPFCEKLCDAAERALEEHENVVRLLRNHGSLANGALTVGLGNAMPGMSVLAAFNARYPDVALTVLSGSHQEITRRVLNHTVDVGILPDVPDDTRFRSQPILTNRVVAIVAPSHRLAGRSQVAAHDLIHENLVFRSSGSSTQKGVDRYFKKHGLTPKPFITLDTRDGVFEAVANGMGIGFTWQSATSRARDLAILGLDGGGTESQEVVFSRADHNMPALDAFYNVLAAEAPIALDHAQPATLPNAVRPLYP